MPFNRSTAVSVLLVVFVGLLAHKNGTLARLGQAINGSLTVGGR